MKKTKVGILFGGKSTEHEVSLQSAKNILDALDQEKYEVTLIGIDKEGHWYLNDNSRFLLRGDASGQSLFTEGAKNVSLVPGSENQQLVYTADQSSVGDVDVDVDVIFPVLHGSYGEDGTIQGLLKLANIPFVGAGVLGSAIGMDKDVTKRILRDAGIPIAKFLVYYSWEQARINFAEAVDQLGLPFFVKPANAGSSVGVSKVINEAGFHAALQGAFTFDNKLLIEEYVAGREIECAVLGNEAPIASTVGEIIAQQDFYSYAAKYLDENGAVLEIPAKLPADLIQEVQRLAVKTFRALCCEGMARVDFFLRQDNQLIVNEINTIPGFTKISMYPKLWEISGISYGALIDRLIQLALERYGREQRLKTSYEIFR